MCAVASDAALRVAFNAAEASVRSTLLLCLAAELAEKKGRQPAQLGDQDIGEAD
jgi:hypothetical protein